MFWQEGRRRSVYVHCSWTQCNRTLMNREHLNTTPELTQVELSQRAPARRSTGFLLTQLALGLIIILWKCGYFCNFHIPNYFCYSNISLALMSQILYLNSVRFLFFVPSEDCSCKIHGLRVGITRASRGWTYQVHSLLVFLSLFPCSFLLLGASAGRKGMKVIYM